MIAELAATREEMGLPERLRYGVVPAYDHKGVYLAPNYEATVKLMCEAADRIEALEDTLKPFAEAADKIEAVYGQDVPNGQLQFPEITMFELRRARATVAPPKAAESKGL